MNKKELIQQVAGEALASNMDVQTEIDMLLDQDDIHGAEKRLESAIGDEVNNGRLAEDKAQSYRIQLNNLVSA